MSIIQAIILGIVEGLTEFIPVSSTGHLILASALMKIKPNDFTKLFIIAIQLGAILSVIVIYWKRFLKVDFNFYRKLIIAFIPAVIFGLLLKKEIDKWLESSLIVSISLIIGGIIFLWVDNWFKNAETKGDNEVKKNSQALTIGLFQVLAMVPGVSRSAATIIGGLIVKLNKKAAAEFSFFLAVPTMLGATAKDLWDFTKKGHLLTHHEITLLLIGNAVAFIVAIFAIRIFINYLTKHGFRIFGFYRILIGIIALLVLKSGW